MKKIVALCVLVLAGLSLYTCKIRRELHTTREMKAMEILSLMGRPAESYTALETQALPEPQDTKDSDILERIRMLKDHLVYNPSPEWIQEVISESEIEIIRLRSGS